MCLGIKKGILIHYIKLNMVESQVCPSLQVLGEDLLVSEELIEWLSPIPDDLSAVPIGTVELRGREQTVNVYSVRNPVLTPPAY